MPTTASVIDLPRARVQTPTTLIHGRARFLFREGIAAVWKTDTSTRTSTRVLYRQSGELTTVTRTQYTVAFPDGEIWRIVKAGGGG